MDDITLEIRFKDSTAQALFLSLKAYEYDDETVVDASDTTVHSTLSELEWLGLIEMERAAWPRYGYRCKLTKTGRRLQTQLIEQQKKG